MQCLLPDVLLCAGSAGSGVTFSDYIEFQHSDDEAGDEAEELLYHNGVSSSGLTALGEDWTWGRLLKDIWKVWARTQHVKLQQQHLQQMCT
jgi:hypothetical protein